MKLIGELFDLFIWGVGKLGPLWLLMAWIVVR